jgi:hypothetical protein
MGVIRNHEFHSRWWGAPVGIIDDVAFLALPEEERRRQLRAFAWVELRAPLDAADPPALARAGFALIDTQIAFRLGLAHVSSGPSLDTLEAESAAERPFSIGADDIAPFSHERFRHLPGITPQKLAGRFALWAEALIDASPEWCLHISSGGATQGWFLSANGDDGLHLELAMLHREARVSGLYVYRKAITTYASRGARIGLARFSVENTPVMNIYASLGAQFLPPAGVWLWVRE